MTFTLVGNGTATISSASPLTVTVNGSGTTQGNLCVVFLSMPGYSAPPTFTFPANWAQGPVQTFASGACAQIWYLPGASNPGGITTISVTFTGGTTVNANARIIHFGAEFSGAASVSPLDLANGGHGTTSPENETATPAAQAHELAVTVSAWWNSTAATITLAPGSGFTQISNASDGASSQRHASGDYNPDTGAAGAAVTDAVTFGSSATAFAWAIATFLPQGSPDVPAIAPGPLWLRLFRPWVQRPVPPPPAFQSVNATGSLSLAPLAFTATAGQSAPDQPSAQPGPTWFDLFKPQWLRPRPPVPPAGPANVTSSGSLALAPLALSGSGGQTSPDLPQAQPGPTWSDLFRPWVQRPRPPAPEPGWGTVTASGTFSVAPLAFAASGGQTSPDLPQAEPGPAWLRLFRPGLPKPPPFLQAQPSTGVTATGSFALAPLALSGSGAQTSPDQPAAQPGPVWQRFFRPQSARPLPPLPAQQPVTSSGSLTLAPLAVSAQGSQASPDLPQAAPGPLWLRLFRPQAPRPLPPQPAVQSVSVTGGLALAPLAISAQGGQTSPDTPDAQPGPVWRRLLRPWAPRPFPPPPQYAQPGVTSTAQLALAPLALSGQGSQTSPDQPQASPGPLWSRLFRPQAPRPLPPAPAVQGVTSAGSFSLAPLSLAAQGSETSPDLPQAQPGPSWLRLFKPWAPRPVPVPPPAPATPTAQGEVLFSLGRAQQTWATGQAQQDWATGSARQQWTAGRARNG